MLFFFNHRAKTSYTTVHKMSGHACCSFLVTGQELGSDAEHAVCAACKLDVVFTLELAVVGLKQLCLSSCCLELLLVPLSHLQPLLQSRDGLCSKMIPAEQCCTLTSLCKDTHFKDVLSIRKMQLVTNHCIVTAVAPLSKDSLIQGQIS